MCKLMFPTAENVIFASLLALFLVLVCHQHERTRTVYNTIIACKRSQDRFANCSMQLLLIKCSKHKSTVHIRRTTNSCYRGENQSMCDTQAEIHKQGRTPSNLDKSRRVH